MNTKIPVLIQLVEHVQCNNQGYFHDNDARSQFPLCPKAICHKCAWHNPDHTYECKPLVLQALKNGKDRSS